MSEETNKYNRKFYIDLDTVAEERNEWFHGGGEEWYHAIKDGYNFGNLGKLGQGFHLYTDPNYILGEVGVVYLYSYIVVFFSSERTNTKKTVMILAILC